MYRQPGEIFAASKVRTLDTLWDASVAANIQTMPQHALSKATLYLRNSRDAFRVGEWVPPVDQEPPAGY